MIELKVVPKPVFWWPYKNILWEDDPEKLQELVRISRTCNIGLQWAPDTRITDAVELEPEILGLHHNIFEDVEEGESPYGYIMDWYWRCLHVKRIIGDQKCEIFLESEKWVSRKEDSMVINLLNIAYDICRYIFSCPVHYYNWGSTYAPISQLVQSDTACVTWNWQQGSMRNYNALKNVGRSSQIKPIRVTMSTDLCYREMPWDGPDIRSANIEEPNQLGQVWNTGRKLARDKSIQSIMIWPTPTMSEHLKHLFMGMNSE